MLKDYDYFNTFNLIPETDLVRSKGGVVLGAGLSPCDIGAPWKRRNGRDENGVDKLLE